MRYVGSKVEVPVLPDTCLSLLLTAATGQAFDYPTTADYVRVTAGTTHSGYGTVYFNPSSTGAVVPTTAGVVTTASSALNIALVAGGPGVLFQRPRSSTGFSVIGGSSHSVSVEFWSKAATSAPA